MNANIKIILVDTSHPGNIGAVARAMKNMQLSNLCLVNPKYFPHVDATARAAGADDLLENAQIYTSLEAALSGSKVIFGTSARNRSLSLPKSDPRQAAQIIAQESKNHQVAIVFGRENNGLSNEELEMCNHHLYIPSNPDFSSLNIASAVQLICYEIQMNNIYNEEASLRAPLTQQSIGLAMTDPDPVDDPASAEQMHLFYEHLQETLALIKFLDLKNPRRVLSRLKLLFNRARVQTKELNILRGILSTIQLKINPCFTKTSIINQKR